MSVLLPHLYNVASLEWPELGEHLPQDDCVAVHVTLGRHLALRQKLGSHPGGRAPDAEEEAVERGMVMNELIGPLTNNLRQVHENH